ncbi:MAG: 4a-hydroxytetrahydrobiopterin dehydratase [Candidatus Sericytochromatia bacterium]|nr:4a-hydroxytetrahydrobiopterin dehydratase [Candidatus Sericytochromatia bacterium]
MSEALALDEVTTALAELPGWTFADAALHKDFVFEHFREAISFLVRLSFEAEALNHHPEIQNVYNRVSLRLTTHDAGNQVTALDLALARAIEAFNWCR